MRSILRVTRLCRTTAACASLPRIPAKPMRPSSSCSQTRMCTSRGTPPPFAHRTIPCLRNSCREARLRFPMALRERHKSDRIGWLRAAVVGANDGIVSTASLVLGVAAAEAVRHDVLVAGLAGLVAGALSMASGEYVSVSSQADTEKADLTLERHELATQPQEEEEELAGIYVQRGLEPQLAREVARQLTAKGALAAHARDELGLTEGLAARPLQAAFASAATFAVGAGVPILTIVLAPA